MSYTKTMPTWEQVNALLKTKDKTPRQWAMSAAFMLNDIRNALEHSAQGEAVAKPIGKVLSESEMGVAYDRKAGSVIWFGTPSPGFIYTAPPAAAVTDEIVERALQVFCCGSESDHFHWRDAVGDPEGHVTSMRAALEAALDTPAEPSIPVNKVREMLIHAASNYEDHWIRSIPEQEADRILAEYAGAGK